MASIASSKLFQPKRVGRLNLEHRVVLAPLTRMKATKTTHIPDPKLLIEYYTQRASTPGTLLITEATTVAGPAAGHAYAPGIWHPSQIDSWKQVVDAVHAKGSFIYLQLWAHGRAATPSSLTEDDSSFAYVAPSAIPLSASPDVPPRALTVEEIKEYVQFYVQAAKNAVFGAGFDGVEVHGAHGYLIDQFIQDVSNTRTDKYGGSIENRSRFALEVVDAVSKAVGEDRTALRLSPWSQFQDMKMADPYPQFTHLVTELKRRHPDLAYLHVAEPRVSGIFDREASSHESNDFIRGIWGPKPLITAGGYSRELAIKTADTKGDLIAFGRHFISNPDLPMRLRSDISFANYDRKTFYIPLDAKNTEVGYIDYPFAQDPVVA